MCTDEQWTPRSPTGTLMISKYWIPSSTTRVNNKTQQGMFSYWLTPLDVPPYVKDYKFSFPGPSACVTHMPCKLK